MVHVHGRDFPGEDLVELKATILVHLKEKWNGGAQPYAKVILKAIKGILGVPIVRTAQVIILDDGFRLGSAASILSDQVGDVKSVSFERRVCSTTDLRHRVPSHPVKRLDETLKRHPVDRPGE